VRRAHRRAGEGTCTLQEQRQRQRCRHSAYADPGSGARWRYVDQDARRYQSMLTEDYLLLENGELMTAAQDIALMPRPEDEYKRSDVFDFRSVTIEGTVAYAVYFLRSEMSDRKQGARKREWLESIVLRRSGDRWRVALLHSTRISRPGA
jgi:ketosteroid isomerase-like protein